MTKLRLFLAASLALFLSSCAFVPGSLTKPVTPAPSPGRAATETVVGVSVRDIRTDAGVPAATGWLAPWDGSPSIVGVNTSGRFSFTTSSTGGASIHFDAPGLVPYDDAVTIAPALADVYMKPALPPVPSRNQLLSAHVMFQGGTCDTKDFGILPWFDAGLFSLSDAGRKSLYECKHAWGDTQAVILFDDVVGSIYNENDNPYYDFQSRHFETDIPGFQAAVREVLQNGFFPKIYLGGDGPEGYPIAMRQFPKAYDALLHAGFGGEDLNRYANYRPGWDSVFYGWEPSHTKIPSFGRLVRTMCPYCVLGIEFNTGHIPLGEGDTDYVSGGDMTDFDQLDIEFNDSNVHDNNTFGIVERLIGPAYVRPADDIPPNDGGDNHPRPWILHTPTPRGPIGVNCFEWNTYEWVRGRVTAAFVAATRLYLQTLGCAVIG